MQTFDTPIPRIRDHPGSVAFSPDGRLLAVWHSGLVLVLDTTTGDVRTLCPQHSLNMRGVPGVGFTADGRGVIAHDPVHEAHAVRVLDVDTGDVVRQLPVGYGDAVEPGPGGSSTSAWTTCRR